MHKFPGGQVGTNNATSSHGIETAFAGSEQTQLSEYFSSRSAGPMTHSLTTSCSVMMTDQFAGFARRIVQSSLHSEVESGG